MPANVSPFPNPVIGDPGSDAAAFPGQQMHPDTCAIRCQEFILQRFTGVDPGEDRLVAEAEEHGWYTPGSGTSPADVGNLLELHGIPVNRYEHANIWQLTAELAQGHKVIIGVDSGELWQQDPLMQEIKDKLGLTGADHAVVVSGIDTTDPHHPTIIISDPGTGEAAATYPMEQFAHSWSHGGFFMMATQDPAPPAFNPEMVNFDYAAGHIPEVMTGVSYDQFAQFEHEPEQWGNVVDKFAALGHDGASMPSPDEGIRMLVDELDSLVGGILDRLGVGHGDGDEHDGVAHGHHGHDVTHVSDTASYDGYDQGQLHSDFNGRMVGSDHPHYNVNHGAGYDANGAAFADLDDV